MRNLKIFENEEFGAVRKLVVNEKPWFVGKDVAGALCYGEPHKAVVKHVAEEDRMKYPIPTEGGVQIMWILNESGLYSLILSGKLQSAKKFKHWVTAEVLPSIRRTGIYSANVKEYDTKATSLGEVASFTRDMGKRMERQGSEPYKIAEAFKMVSEQFGIVLPDDFVKYPDQQQLHLMDFTISGNS